MDKDINKKISKITIIMLIVFLIIGFIAGVMVTRDYNKKHQEYNKENSDRILNQEINNCLLKLNTCSNSIDKIYK